MGFYLTMSFYANRKVAKLRPRSQNRIKVFHENTVIEKPELKHKTQFTAHKAEKRDSNLIYSKHQQSTINKRLEHNLLDLAIIHLQ